MKRADRDRWSQARTLADVGEMTAQWLEGKVAEVPGYCGRPADETRCIASVLIACNRAGFVTSCSQPGYDCGSPGRVQRAAVEGFAEAPVTHRLAAAAARQGLLVIGLDPAVLPRWQIRCTSEVPATRSYGEDFTWFGQHISRRYIRHPQLGWGICHPDAVAALCGAWQLTLIDPQWGRNSVLWPLLAEFAGLVVAA